MKPQKMGLPYTDEKKLKHLQQDITERIDDLTQDLSKSMNYWSWWQRIANTPSVFKILRSGRNLLYGKAYFVQQQFEQKSLLFKDALKKQMELTAVAGEDELLSIEKEKQELIAKTDLQEAYSENADTYITGNDARVTMFQSDVKLNLVEGEHVKPHGYLQKIKDTETEKKDYPEKISLDFSTQEPPQDMTEVSESIPEKQTTHQASEQIPATTQENPVITTFTGDAPDYYVAEQQLVECMEAAGKAEEEKHHSPELQNIRELELSSTSKEVLKQPSYKQNILGKVSRDKVNWAVLVYAIAVASEILIFKSILQFLFNFGEIKAWIAGGSAALISFVIGFGLFGSIQHFIKHNNEIILKHIKSSRLMLFAIIMAILYTLCMGFLYKNSLDADAYRSQISMLTQEQYTYDPDDISDDMSKEEREQAIRENGTKIGEYQTKLENTQSGPMATIASFTVAFSSALFMFLSGIMFSVVLLFLSAYKIAKKIKKLTDEIPRVEAEFYAQKSSIEELDRLALRIINLKGQKRFIEKLLAGGSPPDVLFQKPTKKDLALTHFSTNGHTQEENQINIHF